MTPKEKAKEIYNQCYLLLLEKGEDFGQEILVSILAKEFSLIIINEMIKTSQEAMLFKQSKRDWLQQVKIEIENL